MLRNLVVAILVLTVSLLVPSNVPESSLLSLTTPASVKTVNGGMRIQSEAPPATSTLNPPVELQDENPPPTSELGVMESTPVPSSETSVATTPQEGESTSPAEATSPPEKPSTTPPTTASNDTNDSRWDQLAQCESTGDWHINTGNGYYGGLQFSLQSWQWVGGTGYPHEHSREEQIYRAEKLLELQGWNAWPACSRKLGWR